MRTAAIVLSAGSGTRMNSRTPKQYIKLCGIPVLVHSLKAFQESTVDEIVLVTRQSDREYCRKLADDYGITKLREIVSGGAERYDSVYEGIQCLRRQEPELVLIHDGARPLISTGAIERSIETAKEKGACVLAVPAKDTIKVADADRYAQETPDRSRLWMVQTPQTFAFDMIRSSYDFLMRQKKEGAEVPEITDDAMAAEYAGNKVYLEMGSYENIKITTPEDLEIAEIFLRKHGNEKGR